jgi:hypothetical protein
MEQCFTKEDHLKAMRRRLREGEMTNETKHLINAMRLDSLILTYKDGEQKKNGRKKREMSNGGN